MSDLKLLDGVKVVDMSAFVAAPMAAEILAEYGADVVRIEPLTGDGIRGSGMTQNIYNGDAPLYDAINGNKRHIAVNTRTAEGMGVLWKLLETADIFICHMREKDMVKLGIDWDTLHAKFPALIYANTTGYVRCVATQAPPSAGAAEVAGAAETPETPEVADVAEVAASNETLGMNEAPEANETNEPLAVTEADEAPETNEAPGTPEVAEVAETFAAPEPVVVVSNQARVRVTPSVPSSLAVGEVGFTDAALSWAAADVDGAAFSLAYRVAGSSEWTEITGLTVPACELDGLVQGASYEWRVQAVLGEGDDALASAWAYGESFTTQTMKAYQVTAGADGTWKPGQPGLAFAIDAPRDKFLSLAVDGAELALGTDYTVSDEGMTVTLSPDYLAKLAEGKHELTATFADGAASASFTVAPADPGPTPNPPSPTPPDPTPTPNPPTPNPPMPTPLPDSGGKALAPTGDPLTVALPLAGMLAAACAAAIALAAMRLRKRR